MSELIKISEVALKYDISTRALRYYEDAGLIKSIRTEDYAYRLFDDKAIKRIEQILVLRKLNIAIKDIKKIFLCNSLEALLEVLSNKVNEIDDEVTLLHELKEIVATFIKQLEKCDFKEDMDLNLLYERANVIEERLNESKEASGDSSMERLLEVAEKLEKMPDIRIILLPKVKMARSGNTDLGEFDKWWSSVVVEQSLFPRDFMWYNSKLNYFEWLFTIPENMTDTNGYEVFDFPGGLYAVATAYDEGEEISRINGLIHKWIDESEEFEVSNNENDTDERYDMGHIVSPMGVYRSQMDLFIPIVKKVNVK
ncbi:transcriptional regulator, MerR family [Ruminiclostridium papyrosolvens DSM 2782]|uniref:Transcriptional regulator, MerR family n=1 Tax=Ruminiclostridium papyrosolvens DSM 2782 TaxID=588581 RepID=F1TI27_9FIRM|nr:MerR family transcriptional regulator [Ruminiclostridium papyrosolvens]EGD45962.1 transcriptional regulator, MerR family [Ruminiclostridium papyrosolvens DSM 2782]WES33648.1 MerR family transcriptional regulator [Ruminiclostridium papyrosolvens DSM 2782]